MVMVMIYRQEELQQHDYDWTYCTDYKGDVQCDGETHFEGPTEDQSSNINLELLKVHQAYCHRPIPSPSPSPSPSQSPHRFEQRPDPILWYEEVTLFEDELHDHGTSEFSVRIRVMPACFLILLRHWLRVDGMIITITITIIVHNLSRDVLLLLSLLYYRRVAENHRHSSLS